VPAALARLTALTLSELSNNQLTSVPEELGGLCALKLVHLIGNDLTSAPAGWERSGDQRLYKANYLSLHDNGHLLQIIYREL